MPSSSILVVGGITALIHNSIATIRKSVKKVLDHKPDSDPIVYIIYISINFERYLYLSGGLG